MNLLSERIQYWTVNTLNKCSFWQVNNQIIQQAYVLLSISEKYMAKHSSILLSSINFRALSRPEFNKPLIFYQFQSIIQPSIHQSFGILSISEQYTSHNPSILWSYINFRALSSPAFNKPLILYWFQSNIQTVNK